MPPPPPSSVMRSTAKSTFERPTELYTHDDDDDDDYRINIRRHRFRGFQTAAVVLDLSER